MDNSKPLVSIGIPVYNGASTLRGAVESVIKQDYDNLEIVISDNASTDETPSLCQQLCQEDRRFKYIQQSYNKGFTENFIEVLKYATGEFFMWLGDDDWLDSSYISQCVQVLREEPDHSLVCGKTKYFRDDKFLFEGVKINLQQESARDRVLIYYTQASENGTFYGVMRREQLLRFSFPKCLGSDWFLVAAMAFMGKIKTLESVCLHRYFTWPGLEEGFKRIVLLDNLPLHYANNPYLNIAILAFHDIARNSPIYASLSSIERLTLALDVQQILCQRHGINLSSNLLLLLNCAGEYQIDPFDIATDRQLRQLQIQVSESQLSLTANQAISSYFKNQNVIGYSLLLTSLSELIQQYKSDQLNQATLAHLRQDRKQIADLWLILSTEQIQSAYAGDLGKAHEMVLNSGIKDEPLTDTEQIFVRELIAQISQPSDESKAIQYLLATILYCRADRLPLMLDISCIPEWMLSHYLKFIFQTPSLFYELGEVHNYYSYLEKWVDYFYDNIFSQSDSELWQKAANYFTNIANFIPLYFTTENLKKIYQKRADIMLFALKNRNCQIDWDFPERSTKCNKIRIGILAAHFNPQTETFAALPIYKHLNRDKFEIILYAIASNDHRLERYCSGHADVFVTLPAELSDQVETIRNDDVDILFISTNVTAVTNYITLLALHRLARIQIVDANSPVTTGIPNVDYYLSSKLSEPESGAQEHYTEALLMSDNASQGFDFGTEEQILATTSISRSDLNIEPNAVVYISGANFYKIIPEVEETWAKIIARVPNSVLLLYPFNPNWSSSYPKIAFQRRITTTFAKHGLGKERFLILDPAPNRADIKERLKLGDIYLDSYPYSGMTSLVDPLEVGLPTVVMVAETSRSQKAASVLREIQIKDSIADSEEVYIQLAVAFGNNYELRQQKSIEVHQKMRDNSKFLDSRYCSNKMEYIFEQIFQKYVGDGLAKELKLRYINLIIFPDWSQSEELLQQDLSSAIAGVARHSDKSRITLLIDLDNISADDAYLALSSIAINLMMAEELDVSQGPEISLVGQLTEIEWQALLPKIHGRITLQHENQKLLSQQKVNSISVFNFN
ncbi:MAG: glycosyltransferase [Cyanosarcina radialis HA8281-LM2]|jgi:predicted O-linked N-acetylglucosamine transferase (SPINDLY family)/glycosyltransferase involved in cell wall biosynthesis|nr:glycosyltransferase [Cyanosarcina radialis HA8281-LM2]